MIFDIAGVMEFSETDLNLRYESSNALILTNLIIGMEKGNSKRKYDLILKNLAAIEKKLDPKSQTWDSLIFDVVVDFFAGKIISFAVKKLLRKTAKEGVSNYIDKRFRANNITQESLIDELLGNDHDINKNKQLLKMIKETYNGNFSENTIDSHDFLEELIGEGIDKVYKKTKDEIKKAQSNSSWSNSGVTATLFNKFEDLLDFMEVSASKLMDEKNKEFRKLPTDFEKARKFLIAHEQSINVVSNKKQGDEFFSGVLDDYINSYLTGTVVVSGKVVLPKKKKSHTDLLSKPYYCDNKQTFRNTTALLDIIPKKDHEKIRKQFYKFILESLFKPKYGSGKPVYYQNYKVKDKYKKYIKLEGTYDNSINRCDFSWVFNTVRVEVKGTIRVATLLSATLWFKEPGTPLNFNPKPNPCHVPLDGQELPQSDSILRAYYVLDYIYNEKIQKMALEKSFEKEYYGNQIRDFIRLEDGIKNFVKANQHYFNLIME